MNRVYGIKAYFNLGVSQIAWFSSKLPDIMAFSYLAEKAGYVLSFGELVILAMFAAVILTSTGWGLCRTGLYGIERYAQVRIDPVQTEILETLRELKEMMRKNVNNK